MVSGLSCLILLLPVRCHVYVFLDLQPLIRSIVYYGSSFSEPLETIYKKGLPKFVLSSNKFSDLVKECLVFPKVGLVELCIIIIY